MLIFTLLYLARFLSGIFNKNALNHTSCVHIPHVIIVRTQRIAHEAPSLQGTHAVNNYVRTSATNNASTLVPAGSAVVPGSMINKALAARIDNKRLDPCEPVVVATS